MQKTRYDHVHRRSCLFALLVFISLRSHYYCYASSLKYDCNIGCDLDISINGYIVCGSDDNNYINECLAVCQNVNVVKNGPCSDANIRISNDYDDSSILQTGFITIEKMKQYKNNGFKLIRKLNPSEFKGEVSTPNDDDILSDLLLQPKTTRYSYKPLMINSEGYEYIGNEIVYNTEDSVAEKAPNSAPGYNPLLEEDDTKNSNNNNYNLRNRTLAIIGIDTRVKVINTIQYPYSFIGAVGFSSGSLPCSGTVIYRSAIITAAHCVFNAKTNKWTGHSYFAPGRGHNGIDGNEPFGRWDVDTISFPDSYIKDGVTYYGSDFAVVKLKPNNLGQEIGDVVGYAGLDEVAGYADLDLDQSSITGYPADKGGGTMWTSGICPNGFFGSSQDLDARIGLHDCDTFGGNSGSSVMRIFGATEFFVRGVHVFGARSFNGANVFKQGNGLYDTVMLWSSRISPSVAPTPVAPTPVAPTPAPIASSPPCFSGNNIVEVKNVGEIPIHELKIGDYVKGRNGEFTLVYSFGHKSNDYKSHFLQFYFDEVHSESLPLEISPTHFIYVDSTQSHESSLSYNPPIIKTASEVKIGDRLSGKMITSIHSITRMGVYAPLTESGDIYVSHILASNYVHLIDSPWLLCNQHVLGHIIWYPNRLFCHYMMNVCQEETYKDDGYSFYASWIICISNMINQLGLIASLTLSFGCVPLVAVVHTIELMRKINILILVLSLFVVNSYCCRDLKCPLSRQA